jgi:hypothetical protein
VKRFLGAAHARRIEDLARRFGPGPWLVAARAARLPGGHVLGAAGEGDVLAASLPVVW